MSKTAFQIIAAAHETADEISRVYDANARKASDALKICANVKQSAQGTKNADRLTELARTATAAAAVASEANARLNTSGSLAYSYLCKARRTAAAYKAAATRAGYTPESIERRDAAAEAREIIEAAYLAAIAKRDAVNLAMNDAFDTVMEVTRTAKIVIAFGKAREIADRYPATSASDAAETIRRELDTRFTEIERAADNMGNWRSLYDDAAVASGAVAAVFGARASVTAAAEWDAAREAEAAATNAAIGYDPKAAAEHATEAEAHAAAAEAAASEAANLAKWAHTAEASSHADSAAEYAAMARSEASRARETADQSAAEAEEIGDVDRHATVAEQCADAAEQVARRDDLTDDLAKFARVCADIARESAEKAAASLEYGIHLYFANYEESAYNAEAVRIRREQVRSAEEAATRAALAAAEAEHAAQISAANAVALALLDAYAAVIGEYPAEEDPETVAAYRVAHHDIARRLGSTRADREIVADMVDIIARSARRPDLSKYDGMKYLEWDEEPEPTDIYVVAICDEHGTVTEEERYSIEDERDDAEAEYIGRGYEYANAETIAGDGCTYHIDYIEEPKREPYQPYELLAYIGDPDAYDVEAIEAEATEYTAEGLQVWRAGIDLAIICERHELAAYYPIAS